MELYGLVWQDCAEIGLLCTGWYYLINWLAADRTNRLPIWLYRYTFLFAACYLFGLHTLLMVLTIGAPAWLVLLLLFHQEQLQRNFVTVQASKRSEVSSRHRAGRNAPNVWIKELTRTLVHSKHNSQTVLLVLEQQDDLSVLLANQIPCAVPLSYAALSYLLASTDRNSDDLLWVDRGGVIRSLSARWSNPTSQEVDWLDLALVYTTKTDAIVLYATQANLTFVHNGTVHEERNLHHLPHLFTSVRAESAVHSCPPLA